MEKGNLKGFSKVSNGMNVKKATACQNVNEVVFEACYNALLDELDSFDPTREVSFESFAKRVVECELAKVSGQLGHAVA